MIKIQRFENNLLSSICYIVFDDTSKRCFVIDPGSKDSKEEIAFIEREGLELIYIFITHEHTDHCIGVNALKKYCPKSKIVLSEGANNNIIKANRIFFQFYFDSIENLDDFIPSPDIIIYSSDDTIQWDNYTIHFRLTPGHSIGSMCILLDKMLFTGDTILQYPPVFCGIGCNKQDWKKSVQEVLDLYKENFMVYPGHGEPFQLKDYKRKRI